MLQLANNQKSAVVQERKNSLVHRSAVDGLADALRPFFTKDKLGQGFEGSVWQTDLRGCINY